MQVVEQRYAEMMKTTKHERTVPSTSSRRNTHTPPPMKKQPLELRMIEDNCKCEMMWTSGVSGGNCESMRSGRGKGGKTKHRREEANEREADWKNRRDRERVDVGLCV